MRTWSFPAVLVVISLFATTTWASDVWQFRGPNRDGKFEETGLMKAWPEGGPPVAWVAKGLGMGYSSVSVVKGKIYVPGVVGDQDAFVSVLNLDGSLDGTIPYGKDIAHKEAPCPRSTPTIDGDRLYIVSGLGVVYCIDVAKREKKWEVDILARFGGVSPRWNLAESPLVDGNNVICTPGGNDAILAALDKLTGETVWATKGLTDKAAYCTPAIITHNGRRILVTATEKYIVGVDPDTGALLWSYEHRTPWDIHAVTPVYHDGLLYFTGGSGAGGGALQLSPDGTSVTLKWADKELDCLHHGVVFVDGYLYGTGEKHNYLMCLEMATGKLMWSSKEISQAVAVYADGMLYFYEGPKAGVVSLVKPSPTGLERTGRFTVTEGSDKHWAHPTIANGRLYIRHGDALIAYDIAQK